MSEVTHGQTGAASTVVPATPPPGGDPAGTTTADDLTRAFAGDPVTEAVLDVCAGIYPAGAVLTAEKVRAAARVRQIQTAAVELVATAPYGTQLGELLDAAADREIAYLADPGDQISDPAPGEEVWLAWAIARVCLGLEAPGG